MIQVRFEAMGSRMAAFLDSEGSAARSALAQVQGWFEEWEQTLSRFRADSDLCGLNRTPGTVYAASPVLLAVTGAALAAADLSDGLVDPTLLPYLELAGYTQSFDPAVTRAQQGGGTESGRALLAQGGDLQDWRAIELDFEAGTIRRPAGMKLDLGGVAKGWAAQQAMQRLASFGPVLVDAGGDLAVSGRRADGSRWPVAVDDPLGVHDRLELLGLAAGGVATSGTDYRRWQRNGREMHHLIDPRSGEPAETDLVSVTVVAGDVLQAETAAKTVLILGSSAGQEWLETWPDWGGLLAFQDGRTRFCGTFDESIWR